MIIVNTVDSPSVKSNVSDRWENLPIIKDKKYRATFACVSVPANLPVQMQLKENGGSYEIYASVSAPCNGTVTVVLVPTKDNTVGRFNINFGGAVGEYTIGPVKFEY